MTKTPQRSRALNQSNKRKSKVGISTPKSEIDLIARRLSRLKQEKMS